VTDSANDFVPGTPDNPSRRRIFQAAAATGIAAALPAATVEAKPAAKAGSLDAKLQAHVKNVVVIYLENRSFNNLFADFPGLASPMSALKPEQYQQKDFNGSVLPTLPKFWNGLVPKAQTIGDVTYQINQDDIQGLPNAPFKLSTPQGKPLPEAVITNDLWHLFYQNQMQINGGKNDGFVAWGNTGGMVMGYYGETSKNLGLYQLAKEYTLCDNFFMAAFGGSYLNHQFLISGRTPEYFNYATSPARNKVCQLSDGDQGYQLKVEKLPASALEGMPKYVTPGNTITPDGYVVNTMLPPYMPSRLKPLASDPRFADPDSDNYLPPQKYDTIGHLLSNKGVSWAWYAGGWQAALDGSGYLPKPYFQQHHQPFNYFERFAPGTEERAKHLRDGGLGDNLMTNKFLIDVVEGKLPAVTFYKPQGNLNLHAGYSDVESGDQHVTNVIAHLKRSPQWKNMVVIITFDENGGWWDHVPPPKGDRWGPGSRVPAIIVSPFAKKATVDHSFYDTTSILRFITRLHGLPLLEGLKVRNDAFAARGALPPGDLTGALSFR
jgi:acid phosphatase